MTEAVNEASLDLVEQYADIIQIGARNMQNYSLLKRAGQARKPVLLKRGLSATLEEFLLAAEYVMNEGNHQVILCERGVRTFVDHSRNTLDLSIVPAIQRESHLPIMVDPSHGTGKRNKVIPLSRAAVAVGCDGLMLEVHDNPEQARSDGAQSIFPWQLEDLIRQVRPIAEVLDRTVTGLPEALGATPVLQPRRASQLLPLIRTTSRFPRDNNEHPFASRPSWLDLAALAAICMVLLACLGCRKTFARHARLHLCKQWQERYGNDHRYRFVAPFRTLNVGKNPTGVTPNPANSEVYVVNSDSGSISVIDSRSNQLVATMAVQRSPYSISVTPDGTRAFVANAGSNTVTALNLQNRQLLGNIPVPSQPGLARVSPDGKLVVVSSRGANAVSLIDTQKLDCRRPFRSARTRRILPSCRTAAKRSWLAPHRIRLRRST